MVIIEGTRRATRAAAERVRRAIVEVDQIIFGDVAVLPAEDTYEVIRDKKGYVVVTHDPTIGS